MQYSSDLKKAIAIPPVSFSNKVKLGVDMGGSLKRNCGRHGVNQAYCRSSRSPKNIEPYIGHLLERKAGRSSVDEMRPFCGYCQGLNVSLIMDGKCYPH